ncbi:uncharacterized protein BXZ73DRAFT_101221 [Epithele typhae]|uniref:uncharacterized protein n=1 Tax=Epithele typhae TaxID=378194 RepID=UPI002007DD89|nr:uncharacterized protein BXZ73DRAFT_101221 [Epithele typhae]KAH9932679.1 hypothetical protein BXZ73DRAFT_101221 [Epithele typhae]
MPSSSRATARTSGTVSDEDILALINSGQSLSDLVKELISLRRWKAEQLQKQATEAKRVDVLLNRLCDDCRGTAARWFNGRAGPTDELPVELLHAVFQYASPPSQLVDPIPTRGSHTLWTHVMHWKFNFLRVCKHWHRVALVSMYEDVALRSARQVYAFAAALRGNPALGPLVKLLLIDCPVVLEIRELVVRDLVYIVTQCAGLRTLIFTDSLFTMEDELRRVALYPFHNRLAVAVSHLSDTLTRFEQWPQGGTPHFTAPLHVLAPFAHLRTLAINVDHPAGREPLSLPSLVELDLSKAYDTDGTPEAPPPPPAPRFDRWALPRLTALVLPLVTRVQAGVLRAHGATLTYLEFRDHMEMGLRDADDDDDGTGGPPAPHLALLHLCPRLRHLVFEGRENDVSDADRLPPHPTLAFVDVWTAWGVYRSDLDALFPDARVRRASAATLADSDSDSNFTLSSSDYDTSSTEDAGRGGTRTTRTTSSWRPWRALCARDGRGLEAGLV